MEIVLLAVVSAFLLATPLFAKDSSDARAEAARAWSFDADGNLFRLVSEAQRLGKFRHRCLAKHQPRENRAAGGIGESGELDAERVHHGFHITIQLNNLLIK